MQAVHYLNGNWVITEDLKISAFDLSVVRGFGCFDFLRTYGNKPFLLNDHLDRFFNSAKILSLTVPKTKEEIKSIIYEGIQKNNFPETNIKMILTGGVSEDSITPGASSFIVTFTKAADCPKGHYEQGVKIITVPATRVLTEVKSLDYLMAIVVMQKAKKENAEEALYVDTKGKIYEATRCNLFVVKENTVITAKTEILLGITRKVIIRLVKKLGIPFVERDIFMKELPTFQEAFITASNKEVMPVVKIDDAVVGDGRVGPITKQLIQEYRKFTRYT